MTTKEILFFKIILFIACLAVIYWGVREILLTYGFVWFTGIISLGMAVLIWISMWLETKQHPQ